MHGYVAFNSKNACFNSVAYNSDSVDCMCENVNCTNMNTQNTRTTTCNLCWPKQNTKWEWTYRDRKFERKKVPPSNCFKWIPTGRMFKQQGYKWIPVQKPLESSKPLTEKFNPLCFNSSSTNCVEPRHQWIPNFLFFALMCSLSKCAFGTSIRGAPGT